MWCQWCFARLGSSVVKCKFCGSTELLESNPQQPQRDPDKARKMREKESLKNVGAYVHPPQSEETESGNAVAWGRPEDVVSTPQPKRTYESKTREWSGQGIRHETARPEKFEKAQLEDSLGDSEFLIKQLLKIEKGIDQVRIASERTTHAVRAFVLFLFYQLSSTTAAVFLYFFADIVGNSNANCDDQSRAYGLCAPNTFILFIAFVVWISGVVYSSKVGWEEIQKSGKTY